MQTRDRNEDCTKVVMRVANPYYVYYLCLHSAKVLSMNNDFTMFNQIIITKIQN